MKKAFALLLALLWSPVFASSGPLDGIYVCRYNIPGYGTLAAYVTANTNNGTTVMAVADVSGPPFDGYSIVTLGANNVISGTNSNGTPVTGTFDGVNTITGTAAVNVGGSFLGYTYTCVRFW